jgi:ABC-2 type transport system permease protein
MKQALHAEWTKLHTVAGTGWLVANTIVLTVALGAVVAAAVRCPTGGCDQDPVRLSLTGVQLGQAVVAILAVLIICGEYGTGMIGTTLAAVPRRATVLAAKAAVLVSVVAGAGTVAVLGSVLAGRLLLPDNGFTPANGQALVSLADGPTLRAAVGTVLYLVLIALLSLGVATAVREPATAIGVILGLLYLFPIVTQVVSDPDWERRLQQLAPMTAGLAVQATTDLGRLPIGPWKGLGVLALWAVAALLVGGLVLHRRDA